MKLSYPLLILFFAVILLAFYLYNVEFGNKSIKTMSFNLRLNTEVDGDNAWPYRRDFVVSLIKSHDPDLLGVQEALPEMCDYLVSNLNENYEYWGRGRAENGSDEASAIFFKRSEWLKIAGGFFWLSETPYEPGSMLPIISLPRMVSWVNLVRTSDHNTYFYFNTHYAYENDLVREEETIIYLQQLRNITNIENLQKERKLILSGDFNALPNETCIEIWSNHTFTNLQDTINAIYQDPNVDYGTFHAWSGKANGTRIDYVFVSDDFALKNYEIIHDTRNGRYPSDHFPIITEFKLKNNEFFK